MGEGGLGTMHDVYLGLIGKRIVDFLLVISELFSLHVTAEALRGQFDPKFQVEGDVPTNNLCMHS